MYMLMSLYGLGPLLEVLLPSPGVHFTGAPWISRHQFLGFVPSLRSDGYNPQAEKSFESICAPKMPCKLAL